MRIVVVTDPGDDGGENAALVGELAGRADVRAVTPGSKSGSELVQTATAISRLEPLLSDSRPAAVVVLGDGVAALAAGLVAVKLGMPTARVGAGVRSGERVDPGEINRVVADHVCDLLLCESQDELATLTSEGLAEKARLVPGPDADAGAADAIVAWAGSYTSGA